MLNSPKEEPRRVSAGQAQMTPFSNAEVATSTCMKVVLWIRKTALLFTRDAPKASLTKSACGHLSLRASVAQFQRQWASSHGVEVYTYSWSKWAAVRLWVTQENMKSVVTATQALRCPASYQGTANWKHQDKGETEKRTKNYFKQRITLPPQKRKEKKTGAEETASS